ncbi:MAG: ribosome recycling factor [Candidatus Poribacteria bacterium]|nr:ribosome recycling factor [Candidatus Poribacteria bacterium]
MPDMLILETEDRMEKAVEATTSEFPQIQTGRASLSLLDNVTVEYYGAKSTINQIATVTTPEARLVVIQPWDKSTIKDIEKAISQSDLGLNPNSDGVVIRIAIPELTTERRQELVKLVGKITEEGRISIRNIRRDANGSLKKMEKAKEISEDDRRAYEGDVQDLTDSYVGQIEELAKSKESELLEI